MIRLTKLAGVLGASALLVAACGSSSKATSNTTVPAGSATTTAAVPATTAGGSGSNTASAPGISASTIKIGLITSLTGVASSEYINLPKAVTARFDAANATGGVDGRQVSVQTCDDASTVQGATTCAQSLISKGVFAIVADSAFLIGGAYRVMQQAGIPVTGGAFDGPEWGLQPNTNMFTYTGSLDPGDPQYTQPAQLMKDAGVTSVAAFGYGQSPSSAEAAKGVAFSAQHVGLQVGYLNDSLPFGTVNVTALALTMKQKGVNGVSMEMDANTNFAILTAAKQAGVNFKVAISATGYGQALLDDPNASRTGQGTYFPPPAAPVELKTAGTQAMQAAFAKYANFTGVPDFQWYTGWLTADLMIKGLQAGGQNPTRKSFIDSLHQVTSYDGAGLLARPSNLSLAMFGKAPQQLCLWYAILQGSKFVIANNGQPVCGTLLPNSNQA